MELGVFGYQHRRFVEDVFDTHFTEGDLLVTNGLQCVQ